MLLIIILCIEAGGKKSLPAPDKLGIGAIVSKCNTPFALRRMVHKDARLFGLKCLGLQVVTLQLGGAKQLFSRQIFVLL